MSRLAIPLSDLAFVEGTVADLNELAAQLIKASGGLKIWILEGDMGAGKTHLTAALCRALGVVDKVQSPTFSIVHEYQNVAQQPVYHFDFYRLASEEEALDIGIDEYFYTGAYCFLEWASRVEGLLPPDFFYVHLEIIDTTTRRFYYSPCLLA
ncbi:MAG: tRNA (adenosine(37)-N6)-threonylcarbamoyltransferase complex ATPase subunit type 1 TsaE [Bernardetiaceae bacterium]|nr:tRNA (adenosine(37)-N6)-threonylcarbamoyltransferase complex ATPase subunit type 1 TsaE [Bernardetiaceae bacterium]